MTTSPHTTPALLNSLRWRLEAELLEPSEGTDVELLRHQVEALGEAIDLLRVPRIRMQRQ